MNYAAVIMRNQVNAVRRRAPGTEAVRETWNRPRHDDQIIVLANREPYSHEENSDGRVVVRHSTSGVVSAVEPLIRRTSGVWVAHGSGSADRLFVDSKDGLQVPIDAPAYRLRRVWLSEPELRGFYDGFANEGLWPLCHRAHIRPVFRGDDFDTYWNINSRFVDKLCDEVHGPSPIILVQDYHFALAPQMIRDCLPFSTIVAFWHIPWPSWQTVAICPWARHLVEGLLGSAIVGFQTPADSHDFLETAERTFKGRIQREDSAVIFDGRRVEVRAYPASIEWPSRLAAQAPPVDACRAQVERELDLPPGVRLGVGVARLDYTKGIEETFSAVERLLDSYPQHRGTFTYVQLADPSRTRVPAYRELRERVTSTAARINARYGHGSYRPVILLDRHHEPEEVSRYLRAADLCYVGSLDDGMNLVAKEFVATRDDLRGSLILSAFTGAAGELTGALLVNPYDTDEAAYTIAHALGTSADEQRERMRSMRSVVSNNSAQDWANRILSDAVRVRSFSEVTVQ